MSITQHYSRLIALLKQTPPAAVLKAVEICDGHTIFAPRAFLDAGLPARVVEHLTRTHRSDGSPKGSLYTGGRVVPELKGVYGLDALRFLADGLGVTYGRKMGRGSQAEAIKRALCEHLARSVPPTA